MVFRHCSIGGRVYRGDSQTIDDEAVNKPLPATSRDKKELDSKVEVHELELVPSTSTLPSSSSGFANQASHPRRPGNTEPERFNSPALLQAIEEAVSETVDPEEMQHCRSLNGFFTVLGLCHTVLTSVDPLTGTIEYRAQSPDEAALVQAAADVGYAFCGRDKETLSLRTPSGEVEKYELLHILEFSSARKRMSVVLRRLGDSGRRLFLLTKGADNVIFERLMESPSERELMEETERHLNEFASEGLRTLTLAYKIIDGQFLFRTRNVERGANVDLLCSEEYYREWSERYHAATISIDDREGRIEAVSNELEQNLRLLGATAIEDRLQDGVPETIADLKRAGIKIWVATGDKLETAIGEAGVRRPSCSH